LRVTPTAAVHKGQYAIVIKGPDAKKQEPAHIYHLLIKEAAVATKADAKPVEKYTLDNADPATLAALNAKSSLIRVETLPGAANPNENVNPLKPAAALAKEGKTFQPLANGLTAGEKGLLIAIPLLGSAFFRILFGFLSDKFGSKRVGVASLLATMVPLLWG